MNFAKNISDKLTEVVTNQLDYNKEKKEIIAYAIETAFLFVLGSFLIMLLGYAFNAFMPTIIAATFGGLLRRVSGGAHYNTPLKCLTIGATTYGLIGVLSKKIVVYYSIHLYVLIIIFLISFVLVTLLAPVDSESKPIHSSSFKYKLKITSMLFVIVSFLVVSLIDNTLLSVSAALGVVYQGITLMPVFNKKRR